MAEEEKEDPKKKDPTLAEILSDFAGSPTKEQLDKWKAEHGEIFCSGLSALELFIFRPVKRQEFVQMQLVLAQATEPVTQYQVEEDTVQKCVLWASEPGLSALKLKAGTLSTLNEQVLQNSNFVTPAMASQLVIKL
jgi:hypothetical protein